MPLNKVMLIGNVGKDPDVRYLESTPSPQGQNPKVAQFTLATTEKYRDRNGESHETTEWHNIVAWRGLADLIEKFVKKGTQLYIEGKLRTRSWIDQAGAKQYRTEIIADNIQLLGRRSDNPGSQDGGGYGQPAYVSPPSGNPPQAAPVQASQPSAPQTEPAGDMPSDDLPF